MDAILVVTEHRVLSEYLDTFLKRKGLEVRIATPDDAGPDALEPPPALVVLESRTMADRVWPFVRQAVAAGVPVLILANGFQIEEKVAQQAGADDLLRIPFTAEQLEQAIRRLLGRSRPPAGAEDEASSEREA